LAFLRAIFSWVFELTPELEARSDGIALLHHARHRQAAQYVIIAMLAVAIGRLLPSGSFPAGRALRATSKGEDAVRNRAQGALLQEECCASGCGRQTHRRALEDMSQKPGVYVRRHCDAEPAGKIPELRG
jgi:hypothetical protein